MTATHNCIVLASPSVKVRDFPNTGNISNTTMSKGTAFQISEILPDSLDPNNPAKKWGKIFGGVYNGKYTALEYPGNQSPISSHTVIDGTPPPPNPDPVPLFPESFILTDPKTGAKGEFVFVRIIEN